MSQRASGDRSADPAETVFCVFRVREGREEALLELCRQHDATLRRLDLCTDAPASLYRGAGAHGGGPYVFEIFQWKSSEALDAARRHPEVQKIWEAMAPLCDAMDFPHVVPVPLQA